MRKLLFIVLVGIVSIAQSTAQEKEYLIGSMYNSSGDSWPDISGSAKFTSNMLELSYQIRSIVG